MIVVKFDSIESKPVTGKLYYWKLFHNGQYYRHWVTGNVEDMLELAPIMKWQVDPTNLPELEPEFPFHRGCPND